MIYKLCNVQKLCELKKIFEDEKMSIFEQERTIATTLFNENFIKSERAKYLLTLMLVEIRLKKDKHLYNSKLINF